ncbi:hypothetical protein KR067_006792, partial [Drosophila pandora]
KVSLVINFLILILNPLFNLIPFQVKWQARPISISKNTTDPNYMDLNLKIERFGLGEFAFTGTYFTTIEMDESVTVELRIYSCYSGNEADYKLTPYSIQPQKFIDYLNTFYRDLLMKNLGDCTDLPKYKDGYVPPWPKGTFNFTRCQISGEGMPEVVPEGFYKALVIISTLPAVELQFTVILKVTTKMF